MENKKCNKKCNKELLELMWCYTLHDDYDFDECKSLTNIYKKCVKKPKEKIKHIDILALTCS